jgi:hypothetical protein
MINNLRARSAVVVLGVGLALAATGVGSAVAGLPIKHPTIQWRTDVDGYASSFVGEYFGGKGSEGTAVWRTGIDGYTTSFVGEYFGGKGFAANGYAGTLPTDR